MKRLAIAVALALAAFGCAADVDDPQEEVLATEPQRDPPATKFIGELRDPWTPLVQVGDLRPDLTMPTPDRPPLVPDPYPLGEPAK